MSPYDGLPTLAVYALAAVAGQMYFFFGDGMLRFVFGDWKCLFGSHPRPLTYPFRPIRYVRCVAGLGAPVAAAIGGTAGALYLLGSGASCSLYVKVYIYVVMLMGVAASLGGLHSLLYPIMCVKHTGPGTWKSHALCSAGMLLLIPAQAFFERQVHETCPPLDAPLPRVMLAGTRVVLAISMSVVALRAAILLHVGLNVASWEHVYITVAETSVPSTERCTVEADGALHNKDREASLTSRKNRAGA